jgi:hypothetical protein
VSASSRYNPYINPGKTFTPQLLLSTVSLWWKQSNISARMLPSIYRSGVYILKLSGKYIFPKPQ